MRPDGATSLLRVVTRAAAIGLLCLQGACASLVGPPAAPPASVPTAETAAALQVAAHLEVLQRLVQGSPAEQAEIVASARAASETNAGGSARLRYGLVLACPAHPARDLPQAQAVLRDALSAPEKLTIGERALAVVELQRVDTELRVGAESQRLAAELDHERNRSRSTATVDANVKRLQAEMEETARLRKALDEARAKLDAIANIERNITDRKPPAEGRRP